VRRVLRFRLAIALASCFAASCTDPVDKAAKKRIFSPEDPPQAILSAAEKLPPENVADDVALARRVLGMGAAETTERLGPHRYTANLAFEWSTPGGGKTIRLAETRTLIAGPGGVSGDFHATQENNREMGIEVMRIQMGVYARSRFGKFRQRLRDRGMAERIREETFGAIGDFDSIFQGRLKLTAAQGTVTHEGRTAWKYEVKLGPPGEATPSRNLPALLEPKGGKDDTTRRRMAFFEHRVPKTLVGQVLVDADTSVVLKARLDGTLSVPSEKTPEAADLRMSLESSVTEIGQDPKLQPPPSFLPDADKPEGIADALDRFGIPRGKAIDGGAPADEPDPEED
jgi:hypothetical protein